MSISKVMPVALAVIKDFRVIVAFAVVLFFWAFISFVLYYKKRPPKPKVKKPAVAAPAPAAPAEGGGEAAEASEAPAAE